MYKAFKYRIYPTDKQKQQLEGMFGSVRFIYNLSIEVRQRAWKEHGISLTAYDLMRQVTELKKDCEWLYETPTICLEQSCLNVIQAYKNFFKGSGYPKFKSKYSNQSIAVRNGRDFRVDKEKGIRIYKLGWVKTKFSRDFSGKPKRLTIRKTETEKYFAIIEVDTQAEQPLKHPVSIERSIGIDMGLSHLLITSDGLKIDNPRFLKNELHRLKVLQRRVSRKKKGSSNRRKAVLRLARHHEKISNKRQDFLHKLTTRLIHDSQVDTYCIESLSSRNMMQNHKLAQAISDVSWYEFKRQLKYKADWCGKNVVEINRFEPTSKKCHSCGYINKDLKLSDREWTCQCGLTHDRDINAAINIKYSGIGCAVEPVEVSTLVEPLKQEVISYIPNTGDNAAIYKSNTKKGE